MSVEKSVVISSKMYLCVLCTPGAVAVRLNATTEGRLVSQISFPNSSAALLNNTALTCSDGTGRSNNETFYMAGTCDTYSV